MRGRAAALALVLAASATDTGATAEIKPWKGGATPPLALPDLAGKPVDLKSYAGRVVLVNFWATWCAPCRDEMPSMEMLNRRFGNQVAMVAVSVDDDTAQIARFFGDTKPTFTVLWDQSKKSSAAYGTFKFPETYLIAPDGKIAAKFTGPRDWYNQGTVQYFTEILAGTRKPIST